MILLTPELHAALRVNADHSAESDHDPAPVAKFFNPQGGAAQGSTDAQHRWNGCGGAATWLATELEDDGDTLFGWADLGFGCPELGCFSLSELAGIRLPFGLGPSTVRLRRLLRTGIERDIGFATSVSLSSWADTARRAGSISQAQSIIRRIESAPVPELPTDPESGKGG